MNPGRFQVIAPDETLYGINTDVCWNERFTDQMLIDLSGIHTRMFQLDPVDFGNGLFIQRPGKPFVGAGVWHQGVQSSDFVLGFPFFQCFITVGNDGAIGQSQRRSSDPFVVGSSRGIRKKPLDDRSGSERTIHRSCGQKIKISGAKTVWQ